MAALGSRLAAYQRQLREPEKPEPKPPTRDELQGLWQRGNIRRAIRPNDSDAHKINVVRLERRWRQYCDAAGVEDWKAHLRSLSYNNRGLADSFAWYLLQTSRSRRGPEITTVNSIRCHLRRLNSLFKKYVGQSVDPELREHFKNFSVSFCAPKFGLRMEPKMKATMGPDLFVYEQHFLWARDTSRFHIGLDRLDDSAIRLILMFTGCRKHEIVYNKPQNTRALVEEFHGESDAYTDAEDDLDHTANTRERRCWTCGEADERTHTRELQLLCWEDITLWMIRDPRGDGGRDRLAMQILLRWHKGRNKKVVPTWYLFVEENLPALCPISHILAKALAEGVVAPEGYTASAEPFFRTRLNKKAVWIPWKKEWNHRPVFRQTENSLGVKSNSPLTSHALDSHSNRLGIAMGLPEKLSNYAYRRGYAETVDTNYRSSVRDQGMRHKGGTNIYQDHYHNAMMNAVVQDAFLGRGTKSPYLAILNHMGIRSDEDAPKTVAPEIMAMVGPDGATRRLQQELGELESTLRGQYGRPSRAPASEHRKYKEKQGQLRAARQQQRRKVFRMIYQDFFDAKDEEELQKQLRGIHEPNVARKITHSAPQRNHIAQVMGDMDENLPEEEIVARKIEAINALVAYAFICEPREPQSRVPKSSGRPSSDAASSASERPLVKGNSVATGVPQSLGYGIRIAPKPTNTTLPSPHLVSTQPQTPPPPYHEVGCLKRPKSARGQPRPCIFCDKSYTRTGALWNHLEGHLRTFRDGRVQCPKCPDNFDNVTVFKAHAARKHGSTFRPWIKVVRSGEVNNPTADVEKQSPVEQQFGRRRIKLVRSGSSISADAV